MASLSVLATLGTGLAIVTSGQSLGIATALAIIDRKRALGLMRLMGMPLSSPLGVVVREAAAPRQ